jgi:hypothetical protein
MDQQVGQQLVEILLLAGLEGAQVLGQLPGRHRLHDPSIGPDLARLSQLGRMSSLVSLARDRVVPTRVRREPGALPLATNQRRNGGMSMSSSLISSELR